MEEPTAARSLRSSNAASLRRLMLKEAHVAPLADFVTELRRARRGWEFPDFDPIDGGCNAEILFLFEKPGPRTSASTDGSGFISRDNDDPTAEAIFNFMKVANVPRKKCAIWNVIPGWNGTRRIERGEIQSGVHDLEGLFRLLPKLSRIVFVGKKAQRAHSLIEPLRLRMFFSAHPSPLVRAMRPEDWQAIPLKWAEAAAGL